MRTRLRITIPIVVFAFAMISGVTGSSAEELYFEADFDFFNEQLQEDIKFHLGEAVYVIGYSSFYNEETNEHFPAPDSEFHVMIKNPKNEMIHEDYYISDSEGKIEFPFVILDDFPVGEYTVEMIVDKRKHLDLDFFVGHLPDDVVAVEEKFDLWMENSEVISPLTTRLMGVLCSDFLKESNDIKSVFLDPYNEQIQNEHSVEIKAFYTSPNGEEIITSSNNRKSLCTSFINTSPADIPGEWSVYVTALWMENETLYEARSHSVTYFAKEPLFQGTIEKISIPNPWNNVYLLDWSDDGKSILFTYYLSRDENYRIPQLAVMSSEGYDVTTLDIPLLDTDVQIRSGQFSPDGKFVHFLADGKLFRYDRDTSEVAQLTHEFPINYFDYYQYLEDDLQKYSIVVSLQREVYFDDPSDSGYTLLDIGNGEGSDSLKNAHAMMGYFEDNTFDISPDGKKVLFQKTIESSYGWANRVLAYYDTDGNVVEIPNSQVNCGDPSKLTPNGDMVVYGVHSCGRGAPGGELHLISVDGAYHELILPYDNHNPNSFVISPDGTFLLYVKDSNFELMTMAKPIPEFETIAMMILIFSVLPLVLLRKQMLFKLTLDAKHQKHFSMTG